MSRGVLERWRQQVQRSGRRLAIVAVAAVALSIMPGGGSPGTAATGLAWAQQGGGMTARDALAEFLCCGQTTGGTRIWGIGYPRGWRAVLLPNNPNEFFGALFIDPASSVVVAYIPAATTVPGAVTDVGNVDLFLNGLAVERGQEFRGFREVERRPLPGVPAGRLWMGSWPGAQEQMWEAIIAVVTPTNLDVIMPGMPRGNLTMMGVRAASSEWAQGHAIYEQMVASTRVRAIDGGMVPWDGGIGRPSVAPGMVRFCPRHCDWVWVDADRPGWRCDRDGAPTEPYQVPCR
jgi:hypothetical protein